MRKIVIYTVFVLGLCIPDWGVSQPTSLSQKRLRILTFGDSNGTFPYSWPQQLQQALPNAQVYNISKSGRTIGFLNLGDSTLNSLLVIDKNLKEATKATGDKPYDFVVIELGTNDAKAIFADRQSEVPLNLEKLICKIKDCPYEVVSRAKIVIISPPPYGKKTEVTEKYAGGMKRVQVMAKAFKKVAQRHDCLFVNGQKIRGLTIETMTADGLHLDATGSRKLIEPLVSLLVN